MDVHCLSVLLRFKAAPYIGTYYVGLAALNTQFQLQGVKYMLSTAGAWQQSAQISGSPMSSQATGAGLSTFPPDTRRDSGQGLSAICRPKGSCSVAHAALCIPAASARTC